MSYGNEPTRVPDMVGQARAWRLPELPEKPATVDHWMVHAPFSHPFWPWYLLWVVHLRADEGLPEPVVHFPGATHEVIFIALNPERPLPDIEDPKAIQDASTLTPVDLVHQVILGDDEQAKELLDLVVKAVVAGSPVDQDYRSWWRNVLDQTAEHIRLGNHPH